MFLVTLLTYKGTDKRSIVLTHTENKQEAQSMLPVKMNRINTATVSDFEIEKLLDSEKGQLTLSVDGC